MTEAQQEIQTVICALTGKELPVNEAIALPGKGTDPVFVSAATIFEISMKLPVIRNRILTLNKEEIALNDGLFREVEGIRKAAIAAAQGEQQGASKTIEALMKTAEENGKLEEFQSLVELATKKEAEVREGELLAESDTEDPVH